MQYKTITVSHNSVHKSSNIEKIAGEFDSEYNQIINQQAAEGWKFMGIHPINISRSFGFKDFLLACICIFKCRRFQIDMLIFCREDGDEE